MAHLPLTAEPTTLPGFVRILPGFCEPGNRFYPA